MMQTLYIKQRQLHSLVVSSVTVVTNTRIAVLKYNTVCTPQLLYFMYLLAVFFVVLPRLFG